MEQSKNKLQRAVFLDRDGVLNEDVGYAYRVEDLRLIPGIAAAVATLKSRGFLLIVVSNQSGVARGLFSKDDVNRFNQALNQQLIAAAGVGIDEFFYCPHHPDGSVAPYKLRCSCRKPEPGLILQATQKYPIDLKHSYLVGDKPDDIECARRAGLIGIQVRSRYGEKHEHAAALVDSLTAALPYLT
jgi:D,D-heptose 1,7-bisphosphate phosphatase